MRRLYASFAFVASIGWWCSAYAHDVRGTLIFIDLGSEKAELEVQLPLQELQSALHLAPTWRGPVTELATPEELRRYVAQHLSASSPTGAAFDLRVRDAALTRVDDGRSVVAHATLTAPPGQSVRAFDLRSDLIVHQVVSHNTFVFLRRDLRTAQLGEHPELLGMMHYQNKRLRVDRADGSAFRALRATFALGMRHIDEGTDHLMFLLVLLLPAGLAARRARWREAVGTKASLLQVLSIVTAFTVGHSLTLLLGALGASLVSPRIVEVLIACSILLSGIHAIRPLFAGREVFIAAGFGLVHGLAFSTALQGLAVDRDTLAISVLGFNLGVEAMQVFVVALIMPSLLLLRSSSAHHIVRLVGASFAVVASCGWIAERAFEMETPLPALAERVRTHGTWLVAVLAMTAVGSLVAARSNAQRTRTTAS